MTDPDTTPARSSAVDLRADVEIIPTVYDLDTLRRESDGLGERIAEAMGDAVEADHAGQRAQIGPDTPLARDDVSPLLARLVQAGHHLAAISDEYRAGARAARALAAAEVDRIDDPEDTIAGVPAGQRRLSVPYGDATIRIGPAGENHVEVNPGGLVALLTMRAVRRAQNAGDDPVKIAAVGTVLAAHLPAVLRDLDTFANVEYRVTGFKTLANTYRRAAQPALAKLVEAAYKIVREDKPGYDVRVDGSPRRRGGRTRTEGR